MYSPSRNFDQERIRARDSSLKISRSPDLCCDPFNKLFEKLTKLKPVSPKMKIPKSTLPPRPVRIDSADNGFERVITPKFQGAHSRGTLSQGNLQRKEKVAKNVKICTQIKDIKLHSNSLRINQFVLHRKPALYLQKT